MVKCIYLLGDYMEFLPIILTIIAGLSTLIGLITIFIKTKNINRFIVISLAFSAGVILTLSVFDLLPSSIRSIYKENNSIFLTTIYLNIFFIIGYFLIKIIKVFEKSPTSNLYRVGVISFIILFIHNALEGIATYSLATYNVNMGISLTIGIIMHNIPEGILIAVPIYYSTKNRLKAFKLVLISALSEPIGAVISYLLFKNMYTETFIGYVLIIVSGLMISLIINEIIPEIRKNKGFLLYKIVGFIVGVLFILANLYLF